MTRRDSIIRIITGLVLTGAVTVLLPSCATKKFMLTLHEESMVKNREIESRLVTLEHSLATVDSMTREQYRLIMGTRAIVGNQSQSQQDNLLSLSARLDNIYHMMNELSQKLQAIQLYGGVEAPAPKIPSTSPQDSSGVSAQPNYSPVPASANVDPMEVYNAALADLNNKDQALAESRFMAFLIQFPKHELAGNAQYWLGEIEYARKNYDLAISEFQKVIENYSQSEKVPAAMLKTGYAQIELGKRNTGVALLRKLMKEFPKSEEAKLARARINKLGR